MKSLAIMKSLRMPLLRPPLRHPRWPRPQRGVALIEALVSILIFSFGVLGLVGLEASAINFSVDAQDRNRAALFASDIASSMWLAKSVSVTTNPLLTPQYAAWQISIADPTGTGLPSGTLKITTSKSASDTGTAADTADIVITWKPPTDKTGTIRQLTTRVILPTGPTS
jgi:type IV pilus assembly protein PilV